MTPSTPPDERMAMGIPVSGRRLHGGADVVPGLEALALEGQSALVAGAAWLVCLVSVAIGRPFLLLFIRRRTKQTDQAAQVEIALGDPRFVRRITNLTLLIGIASLADAVLQTALAIVLSTSTFLVATTAIHVATIVGIVLGLFVFLWVRAGR
jgi:hypothetical protein